MLREEQVKKRQGVDSPIGVKALMNNERSFCIGSSNTRGTIRERQRFTLWASSLTMLYKTPPSGQDTDCSKLSHFGIKKYQCRSKLEDTFKIKPFSF